MKRPSPQTFRTAALLGAAVLLASAAFALHASPAQAGGGPAFFKGRVQDLSGSSAGLDKRFAEAVKNAGDNMFFAAAMFPGSSKIRYGGRTHGEDFYTINVGKSRIRIREKAGDGLTISDNDNENKPAPAVWLLLCDGKTGRPVDSSVLDPDRTYEFDSTPVYWLGNPGAAESLGFIEKIFQAHPDADVREKLLFVLSRHDEPRVYDVLLKTALEDRKEEVRRSAVFWLGCIPDARCLVGLKEVFRKEKESDIREHVIFALSLRKEKEAVVEMIRIAKEDRDDSVREKAVFWLGQKATAESVKALKDIVQSPTEEDKLKEQAVFAMSQLPKDKSVPMLIDIARTNKSVHVRKQAMFWLGQSGDPAALKLFEEILLKK